MNDIPTENLPCPCPRCQPSLHLDTCGDVNCEGVCELIEVKFEPAMLVRDEAGHHNDVVAVQECSVCGALVLPVRREKHAAFHGDPEWKP